MGVLKAERLLRSVVTIARIGSSSAQGLKRLGKRPAPGERLSSGAR
jgi:hypothetical protein